MGQRVNELAGPLRCRAMTAYILPASIAIVLQPEPIDEQASTEQPEPKSPEPKSEDHD
jgi:hypothetical protein